MSRLLSLVAAACLACAGIVPGAWAADGPAYGPPVAHVPDPPANDPVARGAYLAGPVGHCIECHTPMVEGGRRDWSRTGAGGQTFPGPWGTSVARNITPDRDHGIGAWTDAQIIRDLTPRKPTRQRDPHRILAKFIRPSCAHGSSPLLHIA